MKSTDYINILGWMVSDMKLKGNELILYALVHGYSKDGRNRYRGSKSYISRFLTISPRSVVNLMNSLIEKGFIKKEENENGGGNFYTAIIVKDSAKVAPPPVKELHRGSEKVAQVDSAKVAHNINNITNHTINDNCGKLPFPGAEEKKVVSFSDEVVECYNEAIKHFEEHLHPNEKAKEKWLDTLDKLNRIDKLPFEAILQIIIWARSNNFWKTNFLSILKLRKKNREGVAYIIVFSEAMKKNQPKVLTPEAQAETTEKALAFLKM